MGVLPAPAYARCVGGTIVIAGNTTGIAMVKGTVLMGHAMSLVAKSELAAGSFTAAGSILNGTAVGKKGETLSKAVTATKKRSVDRRYQTCAGLCFCCGYPARPRDNSSRRQQY